MSRPVTSLVTGPSRVRPLSRGLVRASHASVTGRMLKTQTLNPILDLLDWICSTKIPRGHGSDLVRKALS